MFAGKFHKLLHASINPRNSFLFMLFFSVRV